MELANELQREIRRLDQNGAGSALLYDDVLRVIGIVEEATHVPGPETSSANEGRAERLAIFLRRHRRKLFCAGIGLLASMAFVTFIRNYIPREFLLPLALSLAVLAELTGLALMLSEVLIELPALNRLRKRPLSVMFDILRAVTARDLLFLQRLDDCDVRAVRYVHKYFQHQRIGLERRGGVLSGNIDKVGLIPALLSGLLFWKSLSDSQFSHWLSALAVIFFAFHVLNLMSFEWQQRMDRVLALLEVSIANRK